MSITFNFNLKNSNEMGIILIKKPTIQRAERDVEKINIPGRSGFLTRMKKTYREKTIELECVLKESASIENVCAWLTGMGKLSFSWETDREYTVVIANAIPFEEILKNYKNFIITIDAQPFAHSKIEKELNLNVGTNAINIAGTVYNNPTLLIEGSGTFKISVNGKDIQIETTDNANIDCDLLNACKNDLVTNLNNKLKGNLADITLLPGQNNINITVVSGTLLSFRCKYKEAYL
ncbi:MAG: phage tail family protein [Clostridia bacterium]